MYKSPTIHSTHIKYNNNHKHTDSNFTINLNIMINNIKVGESSISNIPLNTIYWKAYEYALNFIKKTCHNVDGYMFKLMFNEIPARYNGILDFNDVREFIQTDPITGINILDEKVILVKY